MSRTSATSILWLLFSFLLLGSFWLNLKACGMRLFGNEYSFCETAAEANEVSELIARVRQMESQIAEAAVCAE